jgi:hypothetical protein
MTAKVAALPERTAYLLTLAAACVIIVAVFATAFATWTRQYYRARRRGYGPTGAGAAVLCATVFGIALAETYVGPTGGVRPGDWLDAEDLGLVREFFVWLVTPATATAALVAALPRRRPRHGRSRVVRVLHSAAAAWLARAARRVGYAVPIVGLPAVWLDPDGGALFDRLSSTLRVGTMWGALHSAPAWLAYYRRRSAASPLHVVTEQDRRPPVLYLRAFEQESGPFVLLRGAVKSRYSGEPASAATWYDWVTLEQYLGAAFTRDVGPFLALGNPQDVVPPEGAVREYVADQRWRASFLSLAGNAAAVVMEVGRSDNLAWELAALRRSAWQGKLFVITPPVARSWSALYRAFYRSAMASRTFSTAISAPRWAEFARQLDHAGFRAGRADPGPGAVLAFDDAGHARVIASGAFDPEEFTHPIRAHLAAAAAVGDPGPGPASPTSCPVRSASS